MVNSKVKNIVEQIREDNIKEISFKQSIKEGYYLKLDNDTVYLTIEEANQLLKELHIKTDSLLFKVFKLDYEKESYINRILSSIHDLGMLRRELINSDTTKEDLIGMVNYLTQLTKDKELIKLNVDGMQQEELYNIVHRKHLEYYSQYKEIVLTEVNS